MTRFTLVVTLLLMLAFESRAQDPYAQYGAMIVDSQPSFTESQPSFTESQPSCGCPTAVSCGCDFGPACGMEYEPTCECYEAPACGCDFVEPGCGLIPEPTCACGEPSCGLFGEPTCGLYMEPSCGAPAEPTCACGEPSCGLYGEPICGMVTEPTCGLYGEPTCGCGDPTCGLYGEPSCGVVVDPMCGCGSMISEPLCGCDYQAEPTCGFSGNGGLFHQGVNWPKMPSVTGLFNNRVLAGVSRQRRSYFAVGFGFAGTGDEARFSGSNIATLGGLPTYDMNVGGLGMIALGMDFGELRLAAELGFRRVDVDDTQDGIGALVNDSFAVDGHRASTTAMINAYFDLYNGTFLTPYLKGGLGVSRNETMAQYAINATSAGLINQLNATSPGLVTGVLPTEKSTDVAWNLGVGMALTLSRKTRFDVTYQYLNVGDSQTGMSTLGDAIDFGDGGIHEFVFGFRFYQ